MLARVAGNYSSAVSCKSKKQEPAAGIFFLPTAGSPPCSFLKYNYHVFSRVKL